MMKKKKIVAEVETELNNNDLKNVVKMALKEKMNIIQVNVNWVKPIKK